jgi:hypothetical protein
VALTVGGRAGGVVIYIYIYMIGERVWRSAFGTHAAMGFGNAILLTGDVERYAAVWRGVLDTVNANTKVTQPARQAASQPAR